MLWTKAFLYLLYLYSLTLNTFWVEKWMNVWTSKCMGELMNVSVSEWVHGRFCEWIHGRLLWMNDVMGDFVNEILWINVHMHDWVNKLMKWEGNLGISSGSAVTPAGPDLSLPRKAPLGPSSWSTHPPAHSVSDGLFAGLRLSSGGRQAAWEGKPVSSDRGIWWYWKNRVLTAPPE